MAANDVTRSGGVFGKLGNVVVRWPLLVVVFWVALAAVPLLTLPPLAEIVGRHKATPLPYDAPTMVTTREMAAAFHETGSDNVLLVVLTNEDGLGPADEQAYGRLVDKLREDTADVKSVQDFLSAPPLREILQSKDNKAWNVPVNLVGDLGSPQSRTAYEHVSDVVAETVAGTTLTANVTGPAATVADIAEVGERDLHWIEIGTGALVLLILLIVYRNVVTMLLPLVTIVISLATAQGVLAGLAELGLRVAPEAMVLMTAVMVGAGTDYAVFLISRYQDYIRQGLDSEEAVKRALVSIGKVITASAATVAVTFVAMIFAKMPIFSTVGPSIAISIAVACTAAVTLLPAIISVMGPRGWIKPRRDLTSKFWRRSGIRIVRRPRAHLAASLVLLIILAALSTQVRYNYDDRKTLPTAVESAVGYNAMVRHFPLDSLVPQFIFVQSQHDLRGPRALADLEQMAQRVSQVPGVGLVRGITRPTGEPLEQTKATYQAGEVGSKLNEGSQQIANHDGDLKLLTNGADTLADSLGEVRGQVTSAIATVTVLVDALSSVQGETGGAASLGDIDKTARLIDGMRALGGAISQNVTKFVASFEWADPVLTALDGSPICSIDPACRSSRDELRRLVTARGDGSFDKIADLGRQLEQTQDVQSIESTVTRLRSALTTAAGAVHSMGLDQPGGLQSKLAELQQGADALADGSRKLAEGVQLLVDQTRQMGAGLADASAFLLAMKSDAAAPSMAGFYIPPQVLTRDEFKKAATAFVSPDGHAVRYLVQTKLDPFSTAAMDQVNAILDAARGAQPNTALADAKISMGGVSAGLRDTRDYYHNDFQFFVFATILIVLLIMIVLLRAIVAPVYLIGSVVISYLSALGLGVLVFQVGLGQELHWSVPGLTFILLVAVGADYNLLLISRIRDESPHGIRIGVIRTVTSTGGVITSAGLIFAASMLGLMVASITTMIQVGFVIGVGILLDTFLVRTITVPAMAAIVGRANWWPYRWWPARRASRTSAQRHRHRRRRGTPSAAVSPDDEITDVIPTDVRFT
ncbi:RND superfamily putative drug exporter [Mycobacterium sp. OAS707]|uniref:MMPL/RND family transporter n=1 Tax=Mycobacterium sp. OAS707 TaxID=2663822 RepID=UPI00178A583C|nr:RND family transporter [Mycobacterium sp. OAS707]MBE1552853.1 RND superfamily putative drug exporter [Mycobacterium sp. OAS707]